MNFKDKVAIVTGAGGGLGRQHALALAARGARVVVNDFGRPVAQPDGSEISAADAVVAEIRGAGGEAIRLGSQFVLQPRFYPSQSTSKIEQVLRVTGTG